MPSEPPNDVVDLVGPFAAWERIDDRPIGPQVWAAGRWFVTHATGGGGRAQAERLTWAASHPGLEVARVALAVDDPDWLVTDRIDGHPAHRIDLHGDIQGIVGIIASALRSIHDTPVDPDTFPFASGWDAIAAEVEQTASGLDAATLPDPYRRYSAERLLEIWRSGAPSSDELVLCHGGPTAADLVVQGTSATWVDLGRLRLADRHVDLAAMHHSLHAAFGPESVFVFYEAYGIDPDLVRLDHYRLAHLLCG